MADSEPSKPGVAVRELVREAGQAALASALARDGSGRPYASLVLSACDHDGSPVLLLSDLADHSKNLAAEPKASLLFDVTAGRADPLTGSRASLLGELRPVADRAQAARLLARYTARHPGAADYAGFADFRLYRMTVESAHLVAGFGRIHGTSSIFFTDPAPTGERKSYRFTNGGSLRYYDPGNWYEGGSQSSSSCYTLPSSGDVDDWGGCWHHSGASGVDRGIARPLSY